MSKYIVRIGDDIFRVTASDNQEARFKAAQLFKEKHKLDAWLTDIAAYAKTRIIPEPPDVTETTAVVIKKLAKTREVANVE